MIGAEVEEAGRGMIQRSGPGSLEDGLKIRL